MLLQQPNWVYQCHQSVEKKSLVVLIGHGKSGFLVENWGRVRVKQVSQEEEWSYGLLETSRCHSNAVLSTLPEPAQTSALDGLLSNTLTATELIKDMARILRDASAKVSQGKNNF